MHGLRARSLRTCHWRKHVDDGRAEPDVKQNCENQCDGCRPAAIAGALFVSELLVIFGSGQGCLHRVMEASFAYCEYQVKLNIRKLRIYLKGSLWSLGKGTFSNVNFAENLRNPNY